jgi:hypothetical protein
VRLISHWSLVIGHALNLSSSSESLMTITVGFPSGD